MNRAPLSPAAKHRLAVAYKVFQYTICILLALLSIFPFVIMIVNATRSSDQIQHHALSLIPSHYMMNNMKVELLTDKMGKVNGIKNTKQLIDKNMAMYDSPAMENTYHAWEKKNSEQKSFSSEVVRMVNERYRKTSDFYKAAGIDKRVYHKLSSDYGYKPSRMTAFRCCIGLKLNAEEAEELLKLAGMAFSPNDPDDLVLKFCLANGINDIPGINYMMYRYANRPLTDR